MTGSRIRTQKIYSWNEFHFVTVLFSSFFSSQAFGQVFYSVGCTLKSLSQAVAEISFIARDVDYITLLLNCNFLHVRKILVICIIVSFKICINPSTSIHF
jgi:hypothetical protein